MRHTYVSAIVEWVGWYSLYIARLILLVVFLEDGVLGIELGHGLLHEHHYLGYLHLAAECLKSLDCGQGIGLGVLPHLGHADTVVMRRLGKSTPMLMY